MLKSMTGFGKAISEYENKKVNVEIRSLNSKQLDLNIRMPGMFKEKELELRSMLAKELERGKVDVSIFIEKDVVEKKFSINKALAQQYFQELKSISEELKISNSNYLEIILKMPEIFESEKSQLDENEWQQVFPTIQEAITAFNNFRIDEGNSLHKDFIFRINLILELLKSIEIIEPRRMIVVKERLSKNLTEVTTNGGFDKNRFEQELIYFLEKMDISEEKLRLKTHCDYFLETLKSKTAEGRKLGFITQEIGREINTIGSKANDAGIQKMVVQMKDELEKIKEQLLNIL